MDKQQQIEKEIKEAMHSLAGMMMVDDMIENTAAEGILLSDDVINYAGFKKITPFLALLSQRRYNATKYLIDNYPNLNVCHVPEDKMYNPHYLSLKMEQISLAEHLIKQGLDINEKIKNGNTIFMQLFDHKPYMSLNEETLIYALENFKPDLSIKNNRGQNSYEFFIDKCASHCVRNFTPMLKKAVAEYSILEGVLKEKKHLEEKVQENNLKSTRLKV